MRAPWIAARAPASVGPPSTVTVPCASVHLTLLRDAHARASAASGEMRCTEPFGAVRLAERPVLAHCAAANDHALVSTPSERAYLLARALSTSHRPSTDRPWRASRPKQHRVCRMGRVSGSPTAQAHLSALSRLTLPCVQCPIHRRDHRRACCRGPTLEHEPSMQPEDKGYATDRPTAIEAFHHAASRCLFGKSYVLSPLA